MSHAGLICKDIGTSVKHNQNQCHDYTRADASQASRDPGITLLGSWYGDAGIPTNWPENFPCNYLLYLFVIKHINLKQK